MARTTHCIKCGKELTKETRIAFKHTTGTRYMCAECARRWDGGYSSENGAFTSKETATGATISKEMELPRSYGLRVPEQIRDQISAKMKTYGWIKTPDGSVYEEWKTPIYNSLQSYSKVSKMFEQFARVSQWSDDDTYGTHTNVGHKNLDVRIVRKFYESLFTRLYETMSSNTTALKSLYGRSYVYYAQPLTPGLAPRSGADGYAMDSGCGAAEHRLAINVQHKTHIEFRLNKYISFEQDNKVSKYAIDTVLALVEFCDKINANRAALTGEKLKAANKAAAEKTSRKVDNIYRKYAGLPRVNKTA